MAVETHLDDLINFSSTVISVLAQSPEIVGLMVDKAPEDVTEEDMDRARQFMYDFDYIDETVQSAGSFIMVDADMVALPTDTVMDMEIYVQVAVSKTVMELDGKIFKGVRGNRRDNLARQIDLALRGSRDYGIGPLQLVSARTANVPSAFTSKMLTYRSPDFAKNRKAVR